MARRKLPSVVILLGICGLILVAVLLSPAESDKGGSYSTYSAGPSGVRLAFDLSRRLGLRSERRDVPFGADTLPAPVQVLIAVEVGASETHRLLEYVRHGGALLLAGTSGDLGDSLHLGTGKDPLLPYENNVECPASDPFASIMQGAHPIGPVRWTRPAPVDTVGFGMLDGRAPVRRAGVGFPLGTGRVVVVGDADYLINDVMRLCSTESDVAYVKMLRYLAGEEPGTRVEFDEFHHGAGVHGGSFSAIRMYMQGTPSGRMLGQIALAGLLLLIAAAPRPLAPRDPARIARRNPLEHADALAHAYAAVGATRTATARLLDGVRRRSGRGRGPGRETNEQFLTSAAATSPAAALAVSIVTRALADPISPRELVTVAAALSTIEDGLTSHPSPR